MNNIDAVLARFPKTRPPMSPNEAAVHTAIIKRNRERLTMFTQISDALESWMHRQVADDTASQTLLEIGGGTLNHLPFERADIVYDIVEPEREMYADKPGHGRIREFFDDILLIDLNRRYDRIISIATLEHLTDLPLYIATAGLLLQPSGTLRCGIPSEGGLLWGLSWRVIAADVFVRSGHDWAQHMRYEHINTAPEIIAVMRHFFVDVTVRRFPLPSHHLSFYAAIKARNPRLDVCRAYRDSR